ncbi:MAG: hypothetical protein ACE5F2_02150 [Candidatus Paceibacteria bacterium]
MNHLYFLLIGLALVFLWWKFPKGRGSEKASEKGVSAVDKARDIMRRNHQITTAAVVYLIVFVSIWMLFPPIWAYHWGDKVFFFISHICFISIIVMELVEIINKKNGGEHKSEYKIEYKRFSQVVIFLIVIAAGVYRLPDWEKGNNSGDTETETYAQMQESAREITVPVRAWVRVDIPNPDETAWQMTRNPSYGLENTKTLIRVAINGDRENYKPSGQLANGTMKSPYFHETLVKFVEFRSDTVPAHILMNFVKM